MSTPVRLLASLALAASLASTASAQDAAPHARLDTGVVVGASHGAADIYLSIPYAAPPLGPLRWKPPQPAAHWTGERQAITPSVGCMQQINANGRGNTGGYAGKVSEDCLNLDVAAPKGAKRAPVMVWIYGGGNIGGASNLSSLDGTNFARDGVILVSMNYRLGPLGWFAHPSLTAEAGAKQPLYSYGLMDQIAALKWVKRNIAAFGGDPSNVTVFGESAGGIDTLALLSAPSARGLYNKAIVESGDGWSTPPTLAESEAQGAAVATKLGLAGASASAAQLRALPADKLIATITEMAVPAVDGRLLPESTTKAFARGHQNPVPLIIGTNSNEATLMAAFRLTPKSVVDQASPALKAAYAPDAQSEASEARALWNDQNMAGPARWIAGKQSAKAPAWLYYFSYVLEGQRARVPGAAHASEIVFAFDSLDATGIRNATLADRAEASLMHACWIGFAKTGRPACGGGQSWPAYKPASGELLEFGVVNTVRDHFRKAQLDAQEADNAKLIAP